MNNPNDFKGFIINESLGMTPETPVIISENKGINRVTIDTTLQDSDCINRNTRLYPKDTIDFGLAAPYIQERLRTKTWYGEAGHPRKPDVQRQLSYDHHNLSHIILNTRWNGPKLKGHVQAANTTCGGDFDGLIRQGSQVAFSMRAVGPVVEQKKNYVVVKTPLTLFTYDWVVHPSHACAYMDQIISESNNPGSQIIAENCDLIPIQESALVDFIKNESQNVKLLTDQLSIDVLNCKATLSENGKLLYFKENNGSGDTIAVKLESVISHEVNNYLKNF